MSAHPGDDFSDAGGRLGNKLGAGMDTGLS
jgi:hypothetical protein